MATTTPTRPRALDSPSASAGNSGRIGPVHERTLVALFRRQATARGDKPAMFHRAGDRWATITWNAYAQEARELAAFFIDAGLEEGQHVAVWSFNRPEFVITSTATMLSGACTAPLYQTLSAPEAGYVLGHSDAPIAVVENEHLLAKVLEVRDRLPALRRVVLMEGAAPEVDGLAVVSWEDALRRGRDALGHLAVELDRRGDAVQPSDVATLVYTSGTTGPPKAVMATHGNLISAINGLAPIVDLSSDDRVLSYLPLAHILERLNSEVRLYCAGNALWFAASIAEMPRSSASSDPPASWASRASGRRWPRRSRARSRRCRLLAGAWCAGRFPSGSRQSIVASEASPRRACSGCVWAWPIDWCSARSVRKPVSTRRTH